MSKIETEYEELIQVQANYLREIMTDKGILPEHIIKAGIGKNQVYSVLRMGKVDKPNYSHVTFLKICRVIGIHLELHSLDDSSNIDLTNPKSKN